MKKILIIVFIAFWACKKEEPSPTNSSVESFSSDKVLICNEGNFNWGNATISVYDKSTGEIKDSVFYNTNGYNIGDVCQSAYYFNEKIYVVVNNSAKIEVLNSNTFKLEATIDGFVSPRYFLPVSDSKAYVTDLYADKIWIVDLSKNTISGSIKCAGWTEELVERNGKIYITNIEKPYVYVIDSENDNLKDSINLGVGVGSVQKDNANSLWFLRTQSPMLFELTENDIVKQYEIDSTTNPTNLKYSLVDNMLYFIDENISRFDINSTSFSNDFIPSNDRLFYGLGVDASSGDVYVSDAKDYVQNSTVYVYSLNGELKNYFESGIISGYFLFGR